MIGLPVKASELAPNPDATTGTRVVLNGAFHFTSVIKNEDTTEEVALSVQYVTLKTAGATILAAPLTANSTKETEPLTT